MENWCWERESLDLFARHVETGETIPEPLFAKMKEVRQFRAASDMMRQSSFAAVDLALHTEWAETSHDTADPLAFTRDVFSRYAATALPDNYSMVASFGHLFASPVGYAAGYYSYKWAEVLDADAFGRFQREGLLNREVGQAFRQTLLARGDEEEPAQLFEAFMGRQPDPSALLKRTGLSRGLA